MWFLGIFLLAAAGVLCENKDGGKAPRVPLSDGKSMPSFGLGTFLGFNEHGQVNPKNDEVKNQVTAALNAGYRLLDTAQLYKNEEQVGAAVRESSVPRENIFVVTKLAMNRQREVVAALQESLNKMQLPYVDLFLIHFPVALSKDEKSFDVVDYVDTWKMMEEAQRRGLTKSIGLSNFNITQMERLLENCQIKPAVLQVEVNLNLQQERIIDFCKKNNMAVMAYTPFGSMFDKQKDLAPKIDDPVMMAIAKKYNKTVPQIALRFLIQKGVIPIPKSLRKEKIEENIDVFNFELTPQEMDDLKKFNKDTRTVWPSFWQDHPYYPFEKTDKPIPNIFKPQ